MSYIHVREFVEAAVKPTKKLLRDSDPYVRKTACFSVAKLYDHDKTLVESSDLIGGLNNMLRDDNPTVVSSALAALTDIWERSETIKLTIDYTSASKIASILADCSEYVCAAPIINIAFTSPHAVSCSHTMQMESNLHSRSTYELCSPRHTAGLVACREGGAPPIPQ